MTRPTIARVADERGAILIQVTVAIVGLLAFSALVTDYGVLWAARRQAQTAADAAALAGAISLLHNPGDYALARNSAAQVGSQNRIFGVVPNITVGSGSGTDMTQDISFPLCPPGTPGAGTKSCIRVNVYRNAVKDALPTFFGQLIGMTSQGVQATATAEVGSGNSVRCLLPFAVIDRWSDTFDDKKVTTYFSNDAITSPGIDGWTANDDYQPNAATGCTGGTCDTYIAPYSGNTNQTGWTLAKDYGRQLILKDGSPGQYSAGWAQEVDLPNSTGSKDYEWNIENCNDQTVGIATAAQTCSAIDWAHGCVSVKTGVSQGPTSQGISKDAKSVVNQDTAAHWDSSQPGYSVSRPGAVVDGSGSNDMSSPRIRPIVIIDIGNYIAQNCSGTTCIGKVANIIGFFTEGMCKDVTLDTGMKCDDPSKDVVGRIVTLPGSYSSGVGTTDPSATFLEVVRLVR